MEKKKVSRYTAVSFAENGKIAFTHSNFRAGKDLTTALVEQTLAGRITLVVTVEFYARMVETLGPREVNALSISEFRAVVEAFSKGYPIRWQFQWIGGGWNEVGASNRKEAIQKAELITDKLKINLASLRPVTSSESDRITRMTNMD